MYHDIKFYTHVVVCSMHAYIFVPVYVIRTLSQLLLMQANLGAWTKPGHTCIQFINYYVHTYIILSLNYAFMFLCKYFIYILFCSFLCIGVLVWCCNTLAEGQSESSGEDETVAWQRTWDWGILWAVE